MTKKDITKQVMLSLTAAVFVFGGVVGSVWQLLKIDFNSFDFNGFDVKLFLLFIFMMFASKFLIEAAHNIVPSKLSTMAGEQFEQCIASTLRRDGHFVKLTPKSGDYGVDIIMDNHVAIQCKRYSGNVGLKAVQEVYAGMRHYGCERAIVATNSKFTKSAIQLANELGVTLWDGRAVQKMM